MPEGVEVDGCRGDGIEFLFEISAPEQRLAHEGFARRHVAVRLEVPTAHDAPLAGGDQLLDAREEGRLELLHPAVEDGLVVAEDVIELVAEVGGAAECAEGRGDALLPFPLPDRVEVGVAD